MKKLNIAELLKDCPKGMELDCTVFENVKFNYIKEDSTFPIRCFIENDNSRVSFNEYGEFNIHPNAKCVIFPKGKTTWEGFQRPFKDGDILITNNNSLCIYKSIHKTYKNKNFIDFYCGYRLSDNQFVIKEFNDFHFGPISEAKLATEEEKQKLFDAIKANGYKWNPETKTLERLIEPKFKVGNKIEKCGYRFTITEIKDDYYLTNCGNKIPINNQDDYKLVPNKFDISTLKPFDKVLVRCSSLEKWCIDFFQSYNKRSEFSFICLHNNRYKQCIPYEENKYLLGKTDSCDEYYKTWE